MPPSQANVACRFWRSGICRYGQNCNFAHDPALAPSNSTLNNPPPPPPRQPKPTAAFPCKFYIGGYCLRGENCWYKHERPRSGQGQHRQASSTPSISSSPASAVGAASRTVSSTTTTHRTTKASASTNGPCVPSTTFDFTMPSPISDTLAASSATSTRTTTSISRDTRGSLFASSSSSALPAEAEEEEEEEEEEDACGICYDIPKTYGLLASCTHVFCLECIRTWRQKSLGGTNNVRQSHSSTPPASRTCPTCRQESKYVIPSSYFPANPAQKEIIICKYKEAMSKVPCKHFRESGARRWCPFEDQCFFAHVDEHGRPSAINPLSNPRLARARGAQQRGHHRHVSNNRHADNDTLFAWNTDSALGRLLGRSRNGDPFSTAALQQFVEQLQAFNIPTHEYEDEENAWQISESDDDDYWEREDDEYDDYWEREDDEYDDYWEGENDEDDDEDGELDFAAWLAMHSHSA